MTTRVFFTTKLLIALFFCAQAFGVCSKGLAPIRPGAKLLYLEVGSYITFTRDVEIPAFAETKAITTSVSLYINPRPYPQYLPKGKLYKVERSSDYMLGNEQFELYFNPNENATVGDLRTNTSASVELCATSTAAKAI